MKVRLAANIVKAMGGSVQRSKRRRPNVSIVQIAGIAPRKFTRPKAAEAQRAVVEEEVEVEKRVEE